MWICICLHKCTYMRCSWVFYIAADRDLMIVSIVLLSMCIIFLCSVCHMRAHELQAQLIQESNTIRTTCVSSHIMSHGTGHYCGTCVDDSTVISW